MSSKGVPCHHIKPKRDRSKVVLNWLNTLPSLRPPSEQETAKRAALRAEIEGLTLYGLTTEQDRAKIRERVLQRTSWAQLGGGSRRRGMEVT